METEKDREEQQRKLESLRKTPSFQSIWYNPDTQVRLCHLIKEAKLLNSKGEGHFYQTSL